MLRCLYDPRYDSPLPAGHTLPAGHMPAAQVERERLTDAVIADTPKPLWGGPGDYQDLVAERLRALTIAGRIDLELRYIADTAETHEYDYDPLKY